MMDLGGGPASTLDQVQMDQQPYKVTKVHKFPTSFAFQEANGRRPWLGVMGMYMYQLHQVIMLPIRRVGDGMMIAGEGIAVVEIEM